jgi:hypothetical protein
MSAELETPISAKEDSAEETNENHALRVLGWLSVGVAVAALGIYIGNELRKGYKFKRRTPYDFYAHADKSQASEFGVGV